MDKKIYIIISIIALVYIIALINRIVYLVKEYNSDKKEFEDKKRGEVSRIRTKMIREGTTRYAAQISKGIITAAAESIEKEILKKKRKFRYDLINSLVTAITHLLPKS